MFRKKKLQDPRLDEAIDALIEQLKTTEPGTDEHTKIVDELVKLYALKEKETPKGPSPDTVLLVIGNLVGIVAIVGYERFNNVPSRAITFLKKLV